MKDIFPAENGAIKRSEDFSHLPEKDKIKLVDLDHEKALLENQKSFKDLALDESLDKKIEICMKKFFQ